MHHSTQHQAITRFSPVTMLKVVSAHCLPIAAVMIGAACADPLTPAPVEGVYELIEIEGHPTPARVSSMYESGNTYVVGGELILFDSGVASKRLRVVHVQENQPGEPFELQSNWFFEIDAGSIIFRTQASVITIRCDYRGEISGALLTLTSPNGFCFAAALSFRRR